MQRAAPQQSLELEEYLAGDVSLYRYVFNMPMDSLDPWGLCLVNEDEPLRAGSLQDTSQLSEIARGGQEALPKSPIINPLGILNALRGIASALKRWSGIDLNYENRRRDADERANRIINGK